jgi:beta-lactamase regulating signal transducer with metallopeptidase domain/protocatechuate 3,4-dioxygenase beta subunit
MTLADLLREPWVTRAGWTLVHFLWQGSMVAILLATVRALAGRRFGARGRYALSCAALALMTAAPLLTFLALGSAQGNPEAPPLPRPAWPAAGGAALDGALPWIVVAWLAGVLVFSARIALGWRMAARLRRASAGPAPLAWQHALEELMLRMRVTAPVRLLASSIATVPAVVGWLRPIVLMPVEAMIGLPMEQVRALLAHELAHVLRHDYLVNILQSMAEALLFYHPAVWWISNQVRAERELCCDDLAVEASGDALVYAVALADLDSHRRAHLRAAQAANGGSLLHRIRRLTGEAEPLTHTVPGLGAVSALAVLWLAGMGATALNAGPVSLNPHPALRPFVPAGVRRAPPVLLNPPAIHVPRVPPLYTALLFDPFFAPPQAPASPAAGPPAPQKESATLAGTATNTAGQPVANATIVLTQMPVAGTQATIQRKQTDTAGEFSFEGLPPGEYRLQATHPKYLPVRFGSRGTTDPGTLLSLMEGQHMTRVGLTFIEPGTVSGRVVDEDGDPVAEIKVLVLEFVHYNGRRVSSTVAQASSGDNGQFKVDRVPPGTYILRVETQPTWRSNERAPVPALKPGEKDIRPFATYFGGTNDESAATPIVVAGGADLPLGDVKILNRVRVHVRGRVLGDPALLQGARVVRMPGNATSSIGWSSGADIAKDGSFDMANMWKFAFAIEVFSLRQNVPLGWARIDVGDEDLEGVLINAMAGPLHGVVKFESDAQLTPAPGIGQGTTQQPTVPSKSLGRIQLAAAGLFQELHLTAPVSSDGSFTIPLVAPGKYVADVLGLPQGSYLKSARFNSMDALGQGFEWGSDQKGTLEVLIGNRAATISGTVQGDDAKPAPGSTVTLVPDPPRPPVERLYPTAKANDQGQFQFLSVTPGAYKVYAWEEIGSTAHWDPEYVKPFSSASERVELDEGGSATITLKQITAAKMHEELRRVGQ